MWQIAGVTSAGLVRDQNEDRVSVTGHRISEGQVVNLKASHRRQFVLIADGMGGHARGEVASEIAIAHLEAMREILFKDGGSQTALRTANHAVYEAAFSNRALQGMGSTIVGITVDANRCRWFNVGDSRAYLHRAGSLIQISEDHVPHRATGMRVSHSITQSLGGGRFFVEIAPSLGDLTLEKHDRLLLCSDGLSDVLSHVEIEAIISESDVAECVKRLLASCLARGAPDNVSVVLLRYLASSS
ncbi:protein phosphatase 2C domain-containing protein [Mesorhizobium sp. M0130]|uniref:PP2C family protein-serine/threonine phosphatase n=1 Tax=unclassified Mesorhizobium TaxID=325217 RepID=UPI003336934D